MPIDYDHMMSLKSDPVESSYGDQETMLYALGVGLGRDPMNEQELEYVNETQTQRTVPTMAAVLGGGSGFFRDVDLNWVLLVHGEQRLTLHQPLPVAANIVTQGRIVGCYDKGKDKGALIVTETNAHIKETNETLYTVGSTLFFRGDGGFGGPSEGAPAPHQVPTRSPDMSYECKTEEWQALLYRLNGDRNPLHSDPAFASAAGFPKPILHGLCTYGTSCRGVLAAAVGYDHTKIKSFDARFSAPVFPGETIIVDIWKDGNVISYESRLKEREITVIKSGRCELVE